MANPQNLVPQAHVLTVEEASRGGKKKWTSNKFQISNEKDAVF